MAAGVSCREIRKKMRESKGKERRGEGGRARELRVGGGSPVGGEVVRGGRHRDRALRCGRSTHGVTWHTAESFDPQIRGSETDLAGFRGEEDVRADLRIPRGVAAIFQGGKP